MKNIIKKIKKNWKNYSLRNKKIAVIISLIIVIPTALYITENNNQNASGSKRDVAVMVEKVSKLMVLPTGEAPTMFEISDPNFLATKEPFFNGAQKGDILLIYQKIGKAIIYSESRNLIVNAGPLVNAK